MKTSQIVVSVFLSLCLVVGVVRFVTDGARNAIGYSNGIKNAEEYKEKELYQNAVFSYKDALKIKEKKSIRYEMINAMFEGVKHGVFDNSDYIAELELLCKIYPKDADCYEKLGKTYFDMGKYKEAYKFYTSATNKGIKSETLNKLGKKLKYLFTKKHTRFDKILYSPNGYCTVQDDNMWNFVNLDGEEILPVFYNNLTPVSLSLSSAYIDETGCRIIDSENVVQNILHVNFNNAKEYSDGFVPFEKEEQKWDYYNCENDKAMGKTYKNCSSFYKGIAMVKIDDDWKIVDDSFNVINGISFSDVKLYDNGAYTFGNVIIAAENGKYGIYNSSGESLSSFTANNMDNYYEGYIAYQDDFGKWGFVKKNGKTVIKPQFENAKSFSNGLAAVSKNGKWGFVNQKGDIVIECQFNDAGYFNKNGVCAVSDSGDNYYFITLMFSK